MNKKEEKEQRFLALIDCNKQIIYKVCYMYANDENHFNDLYQEVMVNLWQGMDGFRGDAQLSTWVYRVCINTCVSIFRRSGKLGISLSVDEIIDIPYDDSRSSQLKEMYQLINRLNRMEKAIILMWLDEKSYDEIAEVTGLTRNNVASRLHRIKAKLIESGNK